MIIIDIETTELDPYKHSMVSLGAVDYDTGDEFYGECRITGGRIIDPFALDVNGYTEAQCLDITKELPYEMYRRFLDWALIAKRDLLIGGQQVGAFDLLFLKDVHASLAAHDPKAPLWPFGHRSVDLHSVAFAKLRKSLSLDGILQAVGLSSEPKPHNALTGARLERDAFKLLLS